MNDDTASKFISSVVKSIQAVCHGYVEFDHNIEIIGHIFLNVDSAVKYDYILNEQVCKNDRESSTMFVSNSFHAEPPKASKKQLEKQKATISISSKVQENLPTKTVTESIPIESDVMLFASEANNLCAASSSPITTYSAILSTNSETRISSPSHRTHQGSRSRKRDMISTQSIELSPSDNDEHFVNLCDVESSKISFSSAQGASKIRRLSESEKRVPDIDEDLTTVAQSVSETSKQIPSTSSSTIRELESTQTSVGTSSRAAATTVKGPSDYDNHSKDLDVSQKSSRKSPAKTLKEEVPVDVDLTLVKEEEENSSHTDSCMQADKHFSYPAGASSSNYDTSLWDVSSHLQPHKETGRVMRLDASGSSVEYSMQDNQSQPQDSNNLFDNQLFPVMLHANTATASDIMAAVSIAESRNSTGQGPIGSAGLGGAGPTPSTSGHRMDMVPKPNAPRPGRLPRNIAETYGDSLTEGRSTGVRRNHGVLGLPVLFQKPNVLMDFASGSVGSEGFENFIPEWEQGYKQASTNFVCHLCGHHFSDVRKLKRHLISHTLVSRFECSVCGRRFKWKHARDSHMAIHTGIERFKCGICGRKFKWRTSLACHKCIDNSVDMA